jgi:signal peptide peptidase SppA
MNKSVLEIEGIPKDEFAASSLALCAGRDISQKLYNAGLMVDEETAHWLESLAVSGTNILKPSLSEEQMAEMLYGYSSYGDRQNYKPYAMDEGVAVINIKGMLEHDSMWYGTYWTGYDAIRKRFDLAMEDPEVNGIAFMVNTSGGEVAGNFDLVDHIYSKRGKKPMIAVVSEKAYSAGYSLASAADKIVVNRTGGVGSIGVLTIHYDHSKMMKDFGVKPTIIHAGKFKADGNPYENLSPETQARIQARIDGLYTIFVETVARNRNIKADAVRATEAAMYDGEDAVSIGLADSVKSSAAALADFKEELSGSTSIGGISMSTQEEVAAAAQSGQGPQNNAETGYTQAHLEQQVAAAKLEGANAENERMTSILSCDEAKTRGNSALTLAKNPQMSVEMAKEVLGGLPENDGAAPAAGADPLAAAMAASGGGPEAGAGEQIVGSEAAPVIDAGKIYAKINSVGQKH